MTLLSNFFPKRIETSFICFCCSRRALKMCGSVAFLAVLMWFFSAESQSDAFQSITRDYLDSFTNDFCGPCSKYEATPSANSSCTCSGSIPCLKEKYPRGSVFVRSKGKCESSCSLRSKCCVKSVIVTLVRKTFIARSGKKLANATNFWNLQIGYDICKFIKSTQVNNSFPSGKCLVMTSRV